MVKNLSTKQFRNIMETFEERKENAKSMMAKNPKATLKIYELIKEHYESINEWNEDNEDFHLYHLCQSIMLDMKLTNILKKE
jgi:prephenate dehydrogenase